MVACMCLPDDMGGDAVLRHTSTIQLMRSLHADRALTSLLYAGSHWPSWIATPHNAALTPSSSHSSPTTELNISAIMLLFNDTNNSAT
jgi:hypothetical protein